jgi:hypothetical protein
MYSSSMPRKILIMGETLNLQHEVQHDALEDRIIKIINISGSMHKKLLISSNFCVVSKEKHLILLYI